MVLQSDDAETTFDEGRIEPLRSSVRGAVFTPGDDGYDEARTVWNGMIDRHPALIVRATGTADVVTAVEFARANDLGVAVRGGGHNVAGRAVSDGDLTIDLSAMDGVRVDRDRRTVRAGGGATLGDVDHETQLFGLATPLGAVSKTGIAGYTLNGGYGHLTREYGLAADNLVSADVVTADGEVRTASPEGDADLFWAIRGGGGNFGVVTSFEYDLYKVGPDVYVFFAWCHGDDARQVLDNFRAWADTAPRHAGVLPFVGYVPEDDHFPSDAWGEPALAMLGSVRGIEENPRETVEPLPSGVAPLADFSQWLPYEDLQSILDADYPDGLRYYWKSIFLTDLTDEVLDLLVRHNESAPSALSTIDLWHLGGAAADVPQDATAFWHRDKPFMLNFEANWTDPADDDANVEWVREGFAEVESLPVASGRYGNFPGIEDDPSQLFFGENYDRLIELKTAYDPENVFRWNQNIEPLGP
jgi:FAD/FMN-containing dehydrogenase